MNFFSVSAVYSDVADLLALATSGAVCADEVRGLCDVGQVFAVLDDGGDICAAYVLERAGRRLWVSLAGGGRSGVRMAFVLDALIDEQARAAGYESIGFRTERPGLVRLAGVRGYRVLRSGPGWWVMEKEIR